MRSLRINLLVSYFVQILDLVLCPPPKESQNPSEKCTSTEYSKYDHAYVLSGNIFIGKPQHPVDRV
jgi:hypothetical protein